MDQTIMVSRTVLYWIVLGVCDYFHSENPVCSIIKPKAAGILFYCDSYRLHRFQIYIKNNHYDGWIKIYLYSRLSFLGCSRSWLYLVHCAVQNAQHCTQTENTTYKSEYLKRRNQKDITQNTMSHIGFRTLLIKSRIVTRNAKYPMRNRRDWVYTFGNWLSLHWKL